MLIQKPENPTLWLALLAALSFVPTLFFYLVGEEGIYTITSMEMWHSQNWLQQIMYGGDNQRPPLVNWLIMPLANLIGWQHVAVASRTVSIAATLGMVGWVYWLSRKLFSEESFPLFAALATLSLADLLLYRGWLSYTDPVFSFFTFGAMATLWGATLERHKGWLLVSILLLSCAMLSKAFTAYIFYGTLVLVLLRQRPARSFLLSPAALLIFALAVIVPLAWFTSLPQMGGHSTSMVDEILRKISIESGAEYLFRLVTYPIDTAIRLSPTVLLAVYLWWRKRLAIPETRPVVFQTGLLVAALSIAPYWLSPQGGIRYLLPIYPLIALVSARLIWRAGESGRILALRLFAGIIAFKFVFALALFPYYQAHYRGENYARTAQAVIERTRGFPLYVYDVRSVGLSITGYIDATRFPQAPLTLPPAKFDSGFVLSMKVDPAWGEVVETYKLAGDETYLLCRGAACATAK
jgi:4-amino-4-deoxy-L-arabinose transferase-like glycosyltransferase